jgi:hypothetical protein
MNRQPELVRFFRLAFFLGQGYKDLFSCFQAERSHHVWPVFSQRSKPENILFSRDIIELIGRQLLHLIYPYTFPRALNMERFNRVG